MYRSDWTVVPPSHGNRGSVSLRCLLEQRSGLSSRAASWGEVICCDFCCCCLVSKSCLSFATPWTVSPPGSSVHGVFQEEYWRQLPFPPPGDLSNPGIEPESLGSHALAGGFFTTEPPERPLLSHRLLFNRNYSLPGFPM